jgi:membrane-associated phospholipid phosphatase
MSLLQLDDRITFWLYRGDQMSQAAQKGLFFTASGLIYALPLLLAIFFFRSARDRIASIKLALAAGLAWQVLSSSIGGFLYSHYHFRDRPFTSRGLQELLFERPQKAFPSDHSAVIMAIGLGLIYYKYPKLGWVFLSVGMISSLARVVIGFHYFGDVLGGWLLGATALGVVVLLDRPLTALINKIFGRFIGQVTLHG